MDQALVTEYGVVAQRLLPRNVDTTMVYDVVVGSGFGGGLLASALADKGANVLVLEAGSYLSRPMSGTSRVSSRSGSSTRTCGTSTRISASSTTRTSRGRVPAANPSLTLAALALRLATHLTSG